MGIGVVPSSQPSSSRWSEAHQAAERLCTKRPELLMLTSSFTLVYELPDVAKPREVIVVPSCLLDVYSRQTFTEITVYLFFTDDELKALIGEDLAKPDTPIGVGGEALEHLLTDAQYHSIMSGTKRHEVHFFLTSGPIPAALEEGASGYDTAPFSLLTGTRFSIPLFKQWRAVYGTGELPIQIGVTHT